MRNKDSALNRGEPLSELLAGFGFDDPWDSWMLRIREVERARPLGSIGPYEVLGEVGRGGQGVVYKARFAASGEVFAIKRLVAGSVAGPESRARLERELEAASILESPNIVKVFGIDTIEGQPLLAMEWIDGRPITAWAGRDGRERGQVLGVFRTVCGAVHHAHQRGVLHRDLKPSNILVDRTDQARVLDFGLAKLMDAGAEGLTCSDAFLGTPAYAAPEQLRAASRYADVRSDVYSLGVVLRELVLGQKGESPGERTRAEPRAHPDLEAIVRRATAEEPDRRYQSAAELDTDLGRFCAGEPVSARRLGRVGALGRFARRHRLAASVAGGGAALLLGWAVVAGVFAVRLAARSRETEAARRTADKVNSFLQEVLASPRPAVAGAEASVLSVLELASKRVDTDSSLDPATRAGVHVALGRTFDALVRPCEAEPELATAAGLYRQLGPGAQEQLARTLIDLSGVLGEMKRPESVAVALEALAIQERAHGAGSGEAAEARMALGSATWRATARADEAELLMRSALSTLDSVRSAGDAALARHHATLGEFLLARGRNAEAAPELEHACRVLRRFASSESEWAQSLAEGLNLYTRDLLALGLPAEARSVLQERWPLEQRLFGATREAYWYWQLAQAEAGLGMTGPAFEHANTSLGASWRTPEVPTDESDPAPDEAAAWAGDPPGVGPVVYAERVDHALQRQGLWRAQRAEQLRWFAQVCADAARSGVAAALRDRAAAIGHAG